jgi:YcxB-like protein
MQISLAVPYDEEQLRRTLRFILRPQLKTVRFLGGALTVMGIAMMALNPSQPFYYGVVVFGLACLFLIAPVTLTRSVKLQSGIIKDGCHLTLDDEWVTIVYPLAESRCRWAGHDNVIETPEVWYITYGKIQAVAVPKALMTEEQRAEFAAFVTGLHARSDRPPASNRR